MYKWPYISHSEILKKMAIYLISSTDISLQFLSVLPSITFTTGCFHNSLQCFQSLVTNILIKFETIFHDYNSTATIEHLAGSI